MLPLDPPAMLVLPTPISVNSLFRNVEKIGRVITKEYKAWRKLTDQYLGAQQPLPQFNCPVRLTFYVGEKGVGMMDTDNVLKAYTDALVKAHVLTDDSRKWIRRTSAVWVPGMSGAVVRIETAGMDLLADKLRAAVKPTMRNLLK